MRERIEDYARRLEGLSIEALSRSAEELVSLKRRNDALLIAHLAEISKRRGHLELGYASLFDYCQRGLGLADGEVWRRTQVAGVAGRFPQVLAALVEGKVSLAAHLSEENVDELLGKAEGKTTREVKEIVAGIAPKPTLEPGIRRKPVRSGVAEDRGAVLPPPEEAHEPGATGSSLLAGGEPPEPRHEGRLEAARPEVWNFRFSAGKAFKEKLERLAEVLGIAGAERRMPEILERAIDLALDKKDPRRKLERRRRREEAAARREAPGPASAGASSRLPGATTGSAGVTPASPPPGSAGVPPASSSPGSAGASSRLPGATGSAGVPPASPPPPASGGGAPDSL